MKKKRLTKKQLVDVLKNDLGVCLHTALRKLCDSSSTSIVWNAINLDEGNIWPSYLKYLRAKLATLYKFIKTEDDLVNVIRILSNGSHENAFNGIDVEKYHMSFDDEYDWFQHKDKVYSLAMIWSSAFQLFDKDDWEGYCYYLNMSLNFIVEGE